MRVVSIGRLGSTLAALFLCTTAAHSESLPTPLGVATIRTLEGIQPIPSRLLLRDATGRLTLPPDVYDYRGSFVTAGEIVIEVTPGHYTLEARRGLEYEIARVEIEIPADGETSLEIQMHRWIELNSRGWFSGDLHVHRPVEVIPHLMRAEDLNLCTVQSMWNVQSFWKHKRLPEKLVQEVDQNRAFHVLSVEDERDGGAVLMFNLREPIDVSGASRFFPSSLGYIEQAHAQGAWVEQEKPFWWEAPINVAVGGARSTEIINNHFCENFLLNNEAWGRPRDPEAYSPEPIGYCLSVLDIYYLFLNAGFPLIPTAGSATGVLPNPLGYNRCYVHCEDGFTFENWWEGLSEGRHFVTNGPALFVQVNGEPHWEGLPNETEEAAFRIEAIARGGIERIEIIGDGDVLAERILEATPSEVLWEAAVPCSDLSWLAVRVFEPAKETVRIAHTSPTPIEGRVSRKKKEAAEYFLKWLDDWEARVNGDPKRYATPEQKEEILAESKRARELYEAIAKGD